MIKGRVLSHNSVDVLMYNAYAKVHFCAGRPETAVAILHEMFEASVGQVNYRLLVKYLQYTSVLYFAAPSSANRLRLFERMRSWAAAIAKEAQHSGKRDWQQLRSVVQKMPTDHDAVKFPKDLITYIARKESVMK